MSEPIETEMLQVWQTAFGKQIDKRLQQQVDELQSKLLEPVLQSLKYV